MTNLAIFGAGYHFQKNIWPALQQMAGEISIQGLWTRDPEKLERLSQSIGCRALATPAALVQCSEIDTVYICSPGGLHFEHIKIAFECGKHVWCEKSMVVNREEQIQVAQFARDKRLQLAECLMYLHHPHFRRVRSILSEGRLGEIKKISLALEIPSLESTNVRYDKKLGGGALLDLGVYPASGLFHLFPGASFEVLKSEISPSDPQEVDTSGDVQVLVSPHGVKAHLFWGFNRSYRNEIFVEGTRANLRTRRFFSRSLVEPSRIEIQDLSGETEIIEIPPDNHFINMFRNFASMQNREKDCLKKIQEDFQCGLFLHSFAEKSLH